MYQRNAFVMYGVQGVCCVEEIGPVCFSGRATDRDYYTLKPVYSTSAATTVIYVPVDSAAAIRDIASPEGAMACIRHIPTLDAPIVEIKNPKLLSAQYAEMLHSQDCDDLLKMVKSIYLKRARMERRHHHLGATDEKFLTRAESLLCEELAAALHSTPHEMQRQLHRELAACS
jgi:CarD family transcriptional regulator